MMKLENCCPPAFETPTLPLDVSLLKDVIPSSITTTITVKGEQPPPPTPTDLAKAPEKSQFTMNGLFKISAGDFFTDD